MTAVGNPIEAVLTLNATSFHTGLNDSLKAVQNFKNSLTTFESDVKGLDRLLGDLDAHLRNISSNVVKFNESLGNLSSLQKLGDFLLNVSKAMKTFSSDTINLERSMTVINNIFTAWGSTVGNTTVRIEAVSKVVRELTNSENQGITATQQYEKALTMPSLPQATTKINALKMSLVDLWNEYARGNSVINPTVSSIEMMNSALVQNRNEVMAMITGHNEETVSLERNSIALRENGAERLRAMGYTGKLTVEEQKDTNVTNQNTSAHQRNAGAMSQSSARANQLTTATSRLSKAMSSLRMIGNLVGSMLAYNFAHKLLVATGETVHAKSEMEGYFKMLNFGQADIDHFNKALDNTVSQFQRVNKYSLGETISSIGVEFNLTTQEMEKAMKVTSMITSEYLRAGRNANEASLAVKDVLQGQFQRLSRETGVKGEQLKEAGWSGDTTDVLGLMNALEKVAESRNWDVFAEKANSLNDILTILQNRFGEWSADMVYNIQPTIVGVFNALMDVAGMFAQSFTGIWEWLNGGNWEAIATKFTGLALGIGVVSQALVMYRANVSLVEASQLGLKNSIASVVLGLKGQQLAEIGLRNTILAKILGVKAETLAESGLSKAILERTTMTKLETVEDKLNTLSSKENSLAKMENAIQSKINKAELEGLITVEEADTLRKEMNTAMTEANALASLKQAGVNGTLTTTFIALGGAENITAVATGELSVAMGILNGVFALSPIGWITAGILALAGAIYVLTGGLDAHWDKMGQFNDIMQNSDTIINDNNEHLKHLGETLGEDSQIYQFTADAVEGFNAKLGSSKAIVKAYDDEIKNLGVDLGALALKNSQGMGLSDESYKELQEYIPALTEGYNTYYHALQVLHKQKDDYDKSDRTLIANMKERGAEEKDILNKSEQHLDHYNNFIKHSAEHNTSKDWWSGSWSGFLAWLDSIQLWLDYKTEDLANWYHDFSETWSKLPEDLNNSLKNIKFPNIGKMFSDWVNDAGKSLSDSWRDLNAMFEHNIKEPIMNFLSFDWLPDLGGDGDGTGGGMIAKKIDIPNLIRNLFGFVDSIDVSWIPEWFNNNIITPLSTFLTNFASDPMGTLGIDFSSFNVLGTLTKLIFGNGDGSEDNNDISWVNSLFPPIDPAQIMTWVQDNLVTPLSTFIQTGIMSIPLVGDILALFGLVNGDNSGASQKGADIGNAFKNKVEEIIRNIPIVGDVLQMLGLIPQANPDAHSKGQGVGENIKQGEKEGHTGTAQNVGAEMSDVISAITNAISGAFSAAQGVGQAIWDGINSIIQRASPGFIHDQILAEFGTDIPNAISGSGDVAYTVAQGYGQSVVDGISSVNFNSFGALATDYESDAQTMISTTQLLGLDTTMAFNDMALAVNNTTNTMGTNVIGTYNSMSTQQSSMLQNMKTQNMTAYNDMYQKSNQSLIQMRDSTSNITAQMVSAWSHMKNQIVATANQLKSESTSHFNQLSNTIGEFYRKIQNPANWGAGSPDLHQGTRRPMVGRRIGKAIHGAGGGTAIHSRGASTMTMAQLKKTICPNGDCGNLFDGYSLTDKIDVETFLKSVLGEHGFGWNDWGGTHYNYIKTKSDEWEMKSPVIQLLGGINTNSKFKVGDFENGTPKISFDEFEAMARAIFSPSMGGLPYRFYYDSSWKGSWLGAIQAGACNCWDGANALIAFANTCGFSGSIAHGSWNGIPHVWAVIEGRKMDTTGMQNRGTWTPSASAGSPMIRRPVHNDSMSQDNTPVQIEVNINGNVYGVDDLDSHISESIDKGLEKHFNKAYTIGV